MSTTVDQRVVEMKFDNSNFEKNVSESMSTLDKLKAKLNFSDSGKSFENLEKAANGIKLGTLSDTLEGVSVKISGWGVMATRVLSNIADDVYAWAKKLSYALSFENIFAGWTRYGEKTEAVQTIMAATKDSFRDVNTGLVDQEAQLEEVNYQLERLNWFTDETSYNFVDMVSNIGKFTANQVGLEEATTSMMGIANWAAISGANVQMASRAMYNLSQATGAGYLKLIDWKSIENANMATAEFKQAAIDAGVALGTLSRSSKGIVTTMDGTVVSVKNFSQTLSEGWLTAGAGSVIERTLNQYGAFTNALRDAVEVTGLSATDFLVAIDDFQVGLGKGAEKAGVSMNKFSELFFQFRDGSITLEKAAKNTKVSAEELSVIFDEIAAGNADIAEMAEEAEMSTEDLITTLAYLSQGSFEFGRNAFKAAQEAKTFQDAVNATKDAAATAWMNIFESIFGDYTQAKKVWTQLAGDLWDIFVEPVDRLQARLKEAFNTKYWWDGDNLVTSEEEIRDMVVAAADLNGELDLTEEKVEAMVEDWKANHESIKGNEYIAKIMANAIGLIADGLTIIRDAWRKVFAPKSSMGLFYAAKNLSDFLENLRPTKEQIEQLSDALAGLFNIFSPVVDLFTIAYKVVGFLIKEVVSLLWDGVKPLFNGLTKGLGLLSDTSNRTERVNKVVKALKTTISGVFSKIRSVIKSVVATIKSFWDSFKETEAYKQTVGWLVDKLEEFGKKVAEYFRVGSDGSSKFLKDVDWAFGKVQEIFQGAVGWMSDLFGKLTGWFTGAEGEAKSLKDVLTDLWEGLKENNPFAAISSGIKDIKGEDDKFPVFEKFDKFMTDFKNFFSPVSDAITTFNTSGGAGDYISGVFSNIGNGLTSFFSGFTAGDLADLAGGAAGLAAAITLTDSISKLAKAMPNFAGLITSLTYSIKLMGNAVNKYFNAKAWSELGKSLLYIAAAVGVVALAAYMLKDLTTDQLIKSVGAVTLLVLTFGGLFVALGAMAKGPVTPGGLFKSIAMVQQLKGMAIIMIAAVIVLKQLEKVDYDKIKENIWAFSLIVGLVTGVELLVSNFSGDKGGALKLIGFAVSMLLLLRVLERLGEIDFDAIRANLEGNLGGVVASLIAFIGMFMVVSRGAGKGVALMIALPFALMAFAVALKVLSTIVQTIDFGALMIGLYLFSYVINALLTVGAYGYNYKGIFSSVLGLTLGVLILVKAFSNLAEAIKGLLGDKWYNRYNVLAMVLLVFVGMLELLKKVVREASGIKSTDMWSLAATLLAVGGTLWMISGAITKLASVPFWNMLAGAAVMAGMMFMLKMIIESMESINMRKTKGLGKTLAGIAVIAVILSLLLRTIGDMSEETTGHAFVGLILLAGIATILVALIKALSKVSNETIRPAVMLSVAGVLLAMAAIVAGLAMLTKYDLKATLWAAGILVALGLVLALIIYTISKINKVAKPANKIDLPSIYGILGVIAALALIAAGLAVVISEYPGGMLSAIAAMAASMLLFVAFLAIIKKVANGSDAIKLPSLYGVVGIMASLAAIMAAMMALVKDTGGKAGLKNIGLAMAALAGVLLIFAGATALLGVISKNVSVVDLGSIYGVLGVFAALALLVGGLYLIMQGSAGNGGLKDVGIVLAALAGGLILLCGAVLLLGALKAYALAGAAALYILDAAIATLALGIGGGVALVGIGVSLIVEALDKIANWSNENRENLKNGVASAGSAVVDGIKAMAIRAKENGLATAIAEFVFAVITNLAEAFVASIPAMAASLIDVIILLFNGLGDALTSQRGGELGKAVDNFVLSLGEFILEAVRNSNVMTLVLGAFFGISPSGSKGADFTMPGMDKGGNDTDVGLEAAKKRAHQHAQAYARGYSQALPTEMRSAMTEAEPEMENALAESGDNVLSKTMSRVATALGIEIPSGTSMVKDLLGDSVGDLKDFVGEENAKAIEELIGMTEGNVEENVNKMLDKEGPITEKAVVDKTDEVVNTASNHLRENVKEMVGNAADGMVTESNSSSIIARLRKVGRHFGENIVNGFNNYMEIASPSKLMAKEGGYVVTGLVNGLQANASGLVSTGTKIGEKTHDALSESIKLVSDMIEFTDYSQPVIRPVLDLTDVNNGLSSLSGMNGYGLSYALAGQNASAFGSSAESELSDKLDKFTSAITNLLNKPNLGGTTNNWNISGSDPMEIAEQVLQLMEAEVDSKEHLWA